MFIILLICFFKLLKKQFETIIWQLTTAISKQTRSFNIYDNTIEIKNFNYRSIVNFQQSSVKSNNHFDQTSHKTISLFLSKLFKAQKIVFILVKRDIKSALNIKCNAFKRNSTSADKSSLKLITSSDLHHLVFNHSLASHLLTLCLQIIQFIFIHCVNKITLSLFNCSHLKFMVIKSVFSSEIITSFKVCSHQKSEVNNFNLLVLNKMSFSYPPKDIEQMLTPQTQHSQARNPVNIINATEFNEFIKDKVSARTNYNEEILNKAFNLVQPEPGFTLHQTPAEIRPIDICGLCSQLVREPLVCSTCTVRYCIKCSHFMVVIFHLQKKRSVKEVTVMNLEGQMFNCLTISCPMNNLLINMPQNELNDYNVRCVHANCTFVGKYDVAVPHSSKFCRMKSDDFKFDQDYLGEIFKNPIDPINQGYDVNQLTQTLATKGITDKQISLSWKQSFEQRPRIDIESIPNVSTKRKAGPHPNEPQHKRKVKMILSWNEFFRSHNLSGYLQSPIASNLFSSPTQTFNTSTEKTINAPTTSTLHITVPNKIINEPTPSTSGYQSTETCSTSIELLPEIQSSDEDEFWENVNEDYQRKKANELATNMNANHPYRTTADKRREARHRRRERELGFRPKLFNEPTEPINEELKSQTSQYCLKPSTSIANLNYKFSDATAYAPDSKGPTPKVTEFRDDFNSLNAKRSFLYKKHNPQEWNLKERNRKAKLHNARLEEIVKSSTSDMAPPKAYAKIISENAIKAEKMGLKICAIDLENCKLRMKNDEPYSAPLWVSIIDASGRIAYHDIIRHPTSAIVDFGTKFHHLKPEDASKGRGFKEARRTIINILRQYDRIIVSGQTGDFVNIFLSINDHLFLLPRIVCVASYFNTRILSKQSLGLKYISFLLFNVELQKAYHSPLIDAAYTLYAYLLDFERIEAVKRLLPTPTPVSMGFHGFSWPQNRNMSSLLFETMKIIGDWPKGLKVGPYDQGRMRREKMNKQKYYQNLHVIPTHPQETPDPYKLTTERRQSLTNYLQRTRKESDRKPKSGAL